MLLTLCGLGACSAIGVIFGTSAVLAATAQALALLSLLIAFQEGLTEHHKIRGRCEKGWNTRKVDQTSFRGCCLLTSLGIGMGTCFVRGHAGRVGPTCTFMYLVRSCLSDALPASSGLRITNKMLAVYHSITARRMRRA